MRDWRISGTTIVDGLGNIVSASRILSALEDNNGAAIREHFPQLRFQTQLQNALLLLHGKFPDSLSASFCVVDAGRSYQIEPEQDQVIINSKWWYPVREESIQLVKTVLGEKNFSVAH